MYGIILDRQINWKYGSEMYDSTFETIDWLNRKPDLRSNLWKTVGDQYRYFLIHKVVADITDMTLEYHFESSPNADLDFTKTGSVPFTNAKPYEYTPDMLNNVRYVTVFRSETEMIIIIV